MKACLFVCVVNIIFSIDARSIPNDEISTIERDLSVVMNEKSINLSAASVLFGLNLSNDFDIDLHRTKKRGARGVLIATNCERGKCPKWIGPRIMICIPCRHRG